MVNYKDLLIWNLSMDICERIYKITNLLPESEKFGLTSQIRRSAVSVPSNIAEGCGRASTKDRTHFCVIAKGSLNELNTQLLIAKNLYFHTLDKSIGDLSGSLETLFNDIDMLGGKIFNYIESLKN